MGAQTSRHVTGRHPNRVAPASTMRRHDRAESRKLETDHQKIAPTHANLPSGEDFYADVALTSKTDMQQFPRLQPVRHVDLKENQMRSISKKAAVLAAVMAATLLSGCDNTKRLDAMDARIGTVETTANNALAAANKAQSTADGAASAAAEAQKAANDAVEAVSRMAEKCCRK